jgi:2-methylcitrate dehydratase PrpD
VVALREKVTATPSLTISEDEVRVRVTLTDGTRHELHVEHAIGSLERPMSDGDLEAKFRGLVSPLLPAGSIEQLINLCWTLDELPDAAAIARAATPA